MKHFRILIVLLLLALPGFSQTTPKDSLPYLKHPTLPAFMLQNPDSTSFFNFYDVRERPTVLFFFAPDCDHCHLTTQELLKSMDSMKNADFYWFTYMPLTALREFTAKHKLGDYPNIRTGRDHTFFFMKFYGASTVPYLVIYDKNKKLVKLYDGAIKVPEIVSILRGLK